MFFYRSGYFPRERELIWTVDRAEDVRSLEFQLQDGKGELLKREELLFPTGAPRTVIERVSLGSGHYRIDGFVHFAREQQPRHFVRELEVKSEKEYLLRTGG